jgi:hypothetical protein
MWHVMPIQLIGDATDAATHYRRSGFAKQKGPWHYSYVLSIKAENDLERRDALLEEMRRLRQACPQDAVPRVG